MHGIPRESVFALVAQSSCALIEVREEEFARAGPLKPSHTFVVRKP